MSALLQIRGLTQRFGGLPVTDDVSFDLDPGDRVALIGPNGAGKTTLVNLISGSLRPSAGTIFYCGRDVTRLDVARRARLGLVRTFQITRLFRSLSVGENVSLPILQRRGWSRRVLPSAAAEREVRQECEALLARLNLLDRYSTPVGELAYGQQRLVDIAISLALAPRVLLLDEPAAGVPRDEAPHILDTLGRLGDDIAVLLIEHDMDLVFRFARRVLVMEAGRLIFSGSPREVSSNPDVRRAYLGSYAHAHDEA